MGALVVAGALAVTVGFLLSSGYRLEGERLVVQVGLLRWSIPLGSVQRIRRGGWGPMVSSFRVVRLRAAFSPRNLVLETAHAWWREVVISPADERGFLTALRTLAPQVKIDEALLPFTL
ncbi:hypothetical protein HRbin23_00036 [bacterium HR23]|nr:hypothetical protein HRbin23_00036 [bacterium HR23]